MTKQEVYNYFWKMAKYSPLREDQEVYAETAAALFKQIPKYAIENRCPMCKRVLRAPIAPHTLMSGRTVSRRGDEYCPSCGQAIKWEE